MDDAPGLPLREVGERLSFKIEDGKLDYQSLRTSTTEKARAVIKKSVADPEFRRWAGLEAGTVAGKRLVSPAAMGGLFDLAANIEISIFVKKYQLPVPTVENICKWSPEEHKYLDETSADLAEKYIPSAWLQYADLAIFAGAMLGMIKMKMALLERLSTNELERMHGTPAPKPSSELADAG